MSVRDSLQNSKVDGGVAKNIEGRGLETKFSGLSSPRHRLVKLLQFVNFGRIEGIRVRGGEPVLDGNGLLIFRTVKLRGGGDREGDPNQPRRSAAAGNFALKREVLALFKQLDQIKDGLVRRLDVAHGLPMLIEVEQEVAP